MVFSQLLLTGFVSYWLRNQYLDQKDLLREDLSRAYDESFNQVMDSVVFSRVVEPALKDSVTITVMSADNLDSTVNLPPKRLHVEQFAVVKKKQDMLIRSVKLIINHNEDSTGTNNTVRMGFPLSLDSVLFKKFFTEKTEAKKMGISLHWLADSLAQARKAQESGLFFSGMMAGQLPGVLVKNEVPYLVKMMTPQILFGLILLLLTGSAFYYTDRSLKRQVMLNSLRNDFVSNITHELRTPVSTVKVALEALKTFDKVNNPAITAEYLDMATQELNRLDQLISKVLDQSLIGEQNQVIQPQLTDIKPIIEETLLTLQPRLTARNASVIFDNAAMTDAIMVDPLYFQGILINLIDNSLKYGNDSPEIRIKINQDKKSVSVQVGDNGPGIPKEYLDRVFDKFFRVPAGNTHNIKGYGLGLSFAALVMKQHGGSISVESPPAGGCIFTLDFPRQTA